jgi:hypothetical protein
MLLLAMVDARVDLWVVFVLPFIIKFTALCNCFASLTARMCHAGDITAAVLCPIFHLAVTTMEGLGRKVTYTVFNIKNFVFEVLILLLLLLLLPIPVAARSKAWVCGRSLAGIVGSNPAGNMVVCLLWVLSVVR